MRGFFFFWHSADSNRLAQESAPRVCSLARLDDSRKGPLALVELLAICAIFSTKSLSPQVHMERGFNVMLGNMCLLSAVPWAATFGQKVGTKSLEMGPHDLQAIVGFLCCFLCRPLLANMMQFLKVVRCASNSKTHGNMGTDEKLPARAHSTMLSTMCFMAGTQ